MTTRTGLARERAAAASVQSLRPGRLPLPGSLVLLGGLAILLGAGAAVAPRLVGLGLVVVLLMGLTLARPSVAVVLVIAADALALPGLLLGVDWGLVTVSVFGLALTGAASAMVTMPRTLRSRVLPTSFVLAAILVISALNGLAHLPDAQVVAGFRLIATPLCCLLIGLAAAPPSLPRVLKGSALLLAASAIAALAEARLGTSYLISIGLDAGTTVRSYQGQLRAPGLFATNYLLGGFAGVVGALAFAAWPRQTHRHSGRWQVVTVAAAAACLVLSIYRTGILILLSSVLLWVLVARRGALGRKGITILVGGGFVAAVVSFGYASADSLGQRLRLWNHLLASEPLSLIGAGLGAVGAASNSRFAQDRVVVDNYYLSLWLQLGVLALVLLGGLLILVLWLLRAGRADVSLRPGVVLASCLLALALVEFWEYSASMSIVMFAVGCGIGRRARRTAQPALDR